MGFRKQGRNPRFLPGTVATLLLASAWPACGKSKSDGSHAGAPDAGDGGTSGPGGTASGGKGGTSTGGRAGGDSGAGGASTGGDPGSGGADDPGGSSTGGASGEDSGGSSPGGSGGSSAGAGPTAGAGGTRAGSGGTAGNGGSAAGSAGAGGCGLECHPFNQTMLAPCGVDTGSRNCESKSGACPAMNTADPALSGASLYDRTVVMPGAQGVLYDVRVRIHGVTEAKTYLGGTDQASDGTQIPADGFYVGGTPNNVPNSYLVFMIRVASPASDYFLNSIGTALDTRVRHATFTSDYEATIRVEGGTPVTFHVSDANCNMNRNCAEYPDTSCTGNTAANLSPATLAAIGSQPYDGQFLGVTVLGVSEAQ